jgi:hypothetical protein
MICLSATRGLALFYSKPRGNEHARFFQSAVADGSPEKRTGHSIIELGQ